MEASPLDVVLFDIDGTMVDTGGAGRRAIERAAASLYGREDLFQGVLFDGATDRSICRAALQRLERPWQEEEIDRLLSAYLDLLGAEVEQSERYRVFPGVATLVHRLKASGALLGLGTGNLEKGARLKLERSGLNQAFAFGGFGDDAEERAGILRAGIRRAEELLGRPARQVWVIGDTPRDLWAAREVGAQVALVATGRYASSELMACNPDLCLETLQDERALALAARMSRAASMDA
jgi:phosphoglycolate phosphatase-like HAD superfamily hydrolase